MINYTILKNKSQHNFNYFFSNDVRIFYFPFLLKKKKNPPPPPPQPMLFFKKILVTNFHNVVTFSRENLKNSANSKKNGKKIAKNLKLQI